MSDISEHCQQLLDEYESLMDHLDGVDFVSPDVGDASTNKQNQEDLDRLQELREMLDDECDVDLPDVDDEEIDMPDYADGATSEPMDFDQE